ncbi:MAG: putative toxin-antitoxin system toxin component, PIN family [Lachnospiraceae bacterium]|nr:putative toxin-antitoxin system toxin component, PIN family [Lachnospiraceae bacterium]
MKIVIDTNVVIQGVFFGSAPRRVISAVVNRQIEAVASPEIIEEYQEIVDEMIDRKQGKLERSLLAPFISELELIEPVSEIVECRDPDDDKFISCAVDAKAAIIVSGDKDLLTIGTYEGVEIMTAYDFCKKYL